MSASARRGRRAAAVILAAASAVGSLAAGARQPAGASVRAQTVSSEATPTTQALTPSQYVAIALDYLEARAYRRRSVDWPAIRARAERAAAAAPTIADTWNVISDAVKALDDHHSSFTRPPDAARQTTGKYNGYGFLALWPSRQVVTVTDGSPAALGGLRVGDRIDKVDGKPPQGSGGVITIPRDRNGQFPPQITLSWTRKGLKKPIVKTLRVGEVTLVSVPKAAPVPTVGGRSFGRLGYVDIPGIIGDDAVQRSYAAQVQEQIRSLEVQQARCGWIVDLRRNRGGYIYAMLAGLGPLLDGSLSGGSLGGQRDATGTDLVWHYVAGGIVVGSERTVSVEAPFTLPRVDVPVAVLTSRLTASAGEATAIAFRGRPGSRSFGEPTAGLTTFNERKNMPDGAFLDVMSAVDVDRLGRPYEAGTTPDVVMTVDWDAIGTDRDTVLVAASEWLSAQPPCAA